MRSATTRKAVAARLTAARTRSICRICSTDTWQSANPRGFTYEQRVTLRTRGVRRKALLTDLRLTGEEEEGCREVKLTVRIDEKDGSERILQRTSWMTDSELGALVVGKLVTLELVEDDPPWFCVLQDAEMSGMQA